MRPILRWSGLVSTMAAATLCVSVPAQAHATKQYQWQHMSLAETITAQKTLVVQDWKAITTWQSRQAKAIRAGALWKPEPVEIRWHIAHMKWTQRELKESLARRKKLEAQAARERSRQVTSYGGSNGAIVCAVFGGYCSQAIAVATCESHLNTGAVNGQYLGMFQMGDYARSKYGHGSDALTQARAAYAYFRDSGSSWGP